MSLSLHFCLLTSYFCLSLLPSVVAGAQLVRRAIQKGEKIYVNARTIITPSARDMGEPAEVFAKV